MLRIGTERLYTLTEIVDLVREHLEDNKEARRESAIRWLAIALDEDEDFIKGALKPSPWRMEQPKPKEKSNLDWYEAHEPYLNKAGRGRLAELRAATKG